MYFCTIIISYDRHTKRAGQLGHHHYYVDHCHHRFNSTLIINYNKSTTASMMLVFSLTSRMLVWGAFRKTFTTATFSLGMNSWWWCNDVYWPDDDDDDDDVYWPGITRKQCFEELIVKLAGTEDNQRLPIWSSSLTIKIVGIIEDHDWL